MNVDNVKIVGGTPEEIVDRIDRVLGTQLRLVDPGHGWRACGLPGHPTTGITMCQLPDEAGGPDYWSVTVGPRPPINGQAIATMIFRAVTKDTDWQVTQWSDAFGLVAKRPPHRRRSRFRWEPRLFLPTPKA